MKSAAGPHHPFFSFLEEGQRAVCFQWERGSPCGWRWGRGILGRTGGWPFWNPPSGDYTVRVKTGPPSAFRSCSPRVTFRAELRTGLGCVRRLASASSSLYSGDSFRRRGQLHIQGPGWGPTLTLLPQG